MKRLVGAALVLLAMVLVAVLGMGRRGETQIGVDPAHTFHTQGRSGHYGGIDRWAYRGMEAERFAARLEANGYSCPKPAKQVGRELPRGVQEMTCSRMLSSPLPRALIVTAKVDHDRGGRLVAVEAASRMPDDAPWLAQRIADLLRAADVLEPITLPVKGFAPDSGAMLARLAADALYPTGWHLTCTDGDQLPPCVQMAKQRLESGLPQLPSGAVPAARAKLADTAMRGIGLMPVAPQDESHRRHKHDGLLVRVAGAEMWLDYVGEDFSGAPLKVSIALDAKGGAPARLKAEAGGTAMDVALAGEPERNNGGVARYLVPIGASGDHRMAEWLDLPDAPVRDRVSRVANLLSRVDAAFLPGVIKAIAGKLAQPEEPEESLDLYPVLRSVERRAAVLRSTGAGEWFPSERCEELIMAMHPGDAKDDRMMRAAWTMALCETGANDVDMGRECWRRRARTDAGVLDLLRSAVAEQVLAYADLPTSHPLSQHLGHLRKVLDGSEPVIPRVREEAARDHEAR